MNCPLAWFQSGLVKHGLELVCDAGVHGFSNVVALVKTKFVQMVMFFDVL